jgi:hypothetical protein
MIERFLRFSAELTAFSELQLRGTGQAQAYLDAVEGVVGPKSVRELLGAYEEIGVTDREAGLRRKIFGDPKLGPIARNLIKLWYVGIWYQLPRDWAQTYGAREKDRTFMVSASAYSEGLLWPAIGAHPPGAKAPGYGSWTEAPRIPPVPQSSASNS